MMKAEQRESKEDSFQGIQKRKLSSFFFSFFIHKKSRMSAMILPYLISGYQVGDAEQQIKAEKLASLFQIITSFSVCTSKF